MKTTIEAGHYDTRLTPSDWRYSAAALGLVRFMTWAGIAFEDEGHTIAYRAEDVFGEAGRQQYLYFVESYFQASMHHGVLGELLAQETLSEEQVKLVKEKLQANAVMKKVFAKEKYTPENRVNLLRLLTDNRQIIIQETYRNGKSMYANFANTGCLYSPGGEVCRLNGYYLDLPKKKKSAAYNWDYSTFCYVDEPEFDFIPFAFTKTYNSFFINNNLTIKQLVHSNDTLQQAIEQEGATPRQAMFQSLQTSASFIDYDVEVITKARDQDYFASLYVRQKALRIFKAIGSQYKSFTQACRVKDDYIDLEKTVTEAILNGLHLDDLILALLKNSDYLHQISALILVNDMIYGGDKMDIKMKKAYGAAMQVKEAIRKKSPANGDNKTGSYRQKLISAMTLNDYDQYQKVIIQLSAYTGVDLGFAYDLFEDFEANKNVAFTFIMALGTQGGKKDE